MVNSLTMQINSNKDITASLAVKVRSLRKLHNWTAEELAHRAKITPVYVSRIENDKAKNISLRVVSRIAHAFSVPVSILIDEI